MSEKKPWSKKKKIIVGCVAAFVVIGIFGAAGGSSTDNNSNSTAVKQETVTTEPAKEDTKEEVKEDAAEPEQNNNSLGVGDTGILGDYKVTLNSVETKEGDSYFTSNNPDLKILVVDATVENTNAEKEISLSSILMIKVVDSDGREVKETIWGDNNGNLDGSISPGRKITGQYAVEFPKDANPADYEFEFSQTFGSGKLYFRLG